MNQIEMVVDSVGVALINYQKTIILKEKEGKRCLAMWVGTWEADAIATGLQKMYSQVPLTHDFLFSVIDRFGATLKYVTVNTLEGDTFHALASLEKDGKTIEIPCRPSDAFAIAIRAGAPIFVTEDILERSGAIT